MKAKAEPFVSACSSGCGWAYLFSARNGNLFKPSGKGYCRSSSPFSQLMPSSPSDKVAERLEVGCDHLGSVSHQPTLSALEDKAAPFISKVRQLFNYCCCNGFGVNVFQQTVLKQEKSTKKNYRKPSELIVYRCTIVTLRGIESKT